MGKNSIYWQQINKMLFKSFKSNENLMRMIIQTYANGIHIKCIDSKAFKVTMIHCNNKMEKKVLLDFIRKWLFQEIRRRKMRWALFLLEMFFTINGHTINSTNSMWKWDRGKKIEQKRKKSKWKAMNPYSICRLCVNDRE